MKRMKRVTIRSSGRVPNRRVAIASALAIVIGPIVNGPAGAADITNPPKGKREAALQIVACMKKRMASNRLVSYNQAAKDCKERVLNGAGRETPLVAADAKP